VLIGRRRDQPFQLERRKAGPSSRSQPTPHALGWAADRFIGDGWAILGHRLSMPGCKGRKRPGGRLEALALWRTVVVLAGHQREMRSAHLTARLSANLLVRCPRSHGDAMRGL
jgi:hypothetical protein